MTLQGLSTLFFLSNENSQLTPFSHRFKFNFNKFSCSWTNLFSCINKSTRMSFYVSLFHYLDHNFIKVYLVKTICYL